MTQALVAHGSENQPLSIVSPWLVLCARPAEYPAVLDGVRSMSSPSPDLLACLSWSVFLLRPPPVLPIDPVLLLSIRLAIFLPFSLVL